MPTTRYDLIDARGEVVDSFYSDAEARLNQRLQAAFGVRTEVVPEEVAWEGAGVGEETQEVLTNG